MKSFPSFTLCLAAFLAMGGLGSSDRAMAETAKANTKPSATSASTNAAPPEVAIPQSVFEYDGKTAKDPFFPLSTRSPHLPVVGTSEPAITASTFKLKGMSGTPGNPLALINNRTLAPGESAEVTTPTGKHKIHCLEIKKYSVVIRVEGQFEPIEVFLPKSDR